MKNSKTFLTLKNKLGKLYAKNFLNTWVSDDDMISVCDLANPDIDYSEEIASSLWSRDMFLQKDIYLPLVMLFFGCKTQKVKATLGFKTDKSTGVVYANIKQNSDGKWVGCSAFDESYIVHPSSAGIPDGKILEKTYYDCELVMLELDNNRVFVINSYKKKKYKINIQHSDKIYVNIEGKVLYYDPNGVSEKTNTIGGLIRGIAIQPNNFNKRAIIDKVYAIYKTHFDK